MKAKMSDELNPGRELRYTSRVPRKPLPKGRVLVHNHIAHTKDMPSGVNGFPEFLGEVAEIDAERAKRKARRMALYLSTSPATDKRNATHTQDGVRMQPTRPQHAHSHHVPARRAIARSFEN
jgi:hypothetical protein